MSSPINPGDPQFHRSSTLRHSSGSHNEQHHAQAGPSAADSNAMGSPAASSSAASNPFVESQRDRSYNAPQSRPFPASSSSSSHFPGSPSTPGSAPMSCAPSLSALDISANLGEEGVLLSVKCPSLVRDSVLFRFHPDSTILQIKQSIERTWPGKPKAQGLRFIRGGRLLSDDETVRGLTTGTDPNEPTSVHLVIRPDAWLDPKNRPTPSRRSSYLRQLPVSSPLVTPGLRELSSPYFSTVPTQSPLQSPRTSPTLQTSPLPELHHPALSASRNSRNSRRTASNSSDSSTSSSSSATPANASTTPSRREKPTHSAPPDASAMHGFGGGAWWDTTVADFALPTKFIASNHDGSGDNDRFRQIFMATAPSNYPLLVDSAILVHDLYLEQYRRLYKASQKGQFGVTSKLGQGLKASVSVVDSDDVELDDAYDSDEDQDQDQDDERLSLARSVESELFGWDPIEMPPLDCEQDAVDGKNLQYLYHEVQCNGLPYLLQLAVRPADQQRSAAMSQLLSRMERLASTVKSLNSLTLHANLLSDPSTTAPTGVFSSSGTMPTNVLIVGAPPGGGEPHEQHRQPGVNPWAARPPAPGLAVTVANLIPDSVRTTFLGLAELTWNEIFSMMIPLFFLGLKLGIMLYVFGRNASNLKRYSMMAAATLYVVWEAVKMVKRRTEQRLAARMRQAAAAARPAADQQGAGVGGNVERAAGADVPRASPPAAAASAAEGSNDGALDPLAPLPPVHAPRRYSTAHLSLYNAEHWLERIAYIGMDSEDVDLGLLPPSGSPARSRAEIRRGRFFHLVVVPLVLFFATMVPDIEMKRRRAIEEREDTVREAVRRQEERREKIREMKRQQMESEGSGERDSQQGASIGHEEAGASGESKVLSDYSERILRRRRGGAAAADLDGRDADAIRAAARADDEAEQGGDLDFF